MNWLLLGAVIILGGTLVSKAVTYYSFYQTWDFSFSVSKLRLKPKSLTVLLFDVVMVIKNPTNAKASIDNPFVQFYYKGELISQSKLGAATIKINPNSDTQLSPITMELDIMDARLKDIATEFRKSGKLDALYKFFDIRLTGSVMGQTATLKKNLA